MSLDLQVAFATFAKRYRENVKNRTFDFLLEVRCTTFVMVAISRWQPCQRDGL